MHEQSETLNRSIKSLTPWMSLHGWFYIAAGVIYCLSIVGAIFGIPLLIAGNGLLKSSKILKFYSENPTTEDFNKALDGQRAFFVTTGILFIVAIILPTLLGISLFMAMLFNPEVNKEIELWSNRLPEISQPVSKAKEI